MNLVEFVFSIAIFKSLGFWSVATALRKFVMAATINNAAGTPFPETSAIVIIIIGLNRVDKHCVLSVKKYLPFVKNFLTRRRVLNVVREVINIENSQSGLSRSQCIILITALDNYIKPVVTAGRKH